MADSKTSDKKSGSKSTTSSKKAAPARVWNVQTHGTPTDRQRKLYDVVGE